MVVRLSSRSLEAVNLTKQYGSFTALSDLNLKIEGSKCVGFLGPNGAGKTTTLKLFTDMIRASKGEAIINGFNVHTDKKSALASCGVLIESPEIYPSLTPKEALSMIAEIRGIPAGERNGRIAEVMAEVKMEEWLDKKVGKFSKGMKQRINVASSLLTDPDIVMLDEPTTGMDPRGMAEVRDIIKCMKQKGRLIFMSSHLLNEVSDVCDEVAMIDHGKLLVYDTIENVTYRFGGGLGGDVVDIMFRNPVDAGALSRISSIRNVVSAEKIDSRSVRIKFSGGLESQENLLSDLVSLRVGLVSFHPASSALEDSYLNLIKESK